MSGLPGTDQPRVSANDWRVLPVPELGAWAPTLSVSVVIPAHDPVHLPLVLAGLAAQGYPAHLLEVVVVDDGSRPPVELPDVRPERTRLVQVDSGWGRAAACQSGADHSDGEVIHWLDADMVPHRDEVEAQLRWHHVVDYAVVLGSKVFADPGALDHVPPATLRGGLADGTPPEDLARGEVVPHAWIDQILETTEGLATAGPRAMRVHVGASASLTRSLFEASGGMPVDLVLGEDIVLGYRLREAGGVFIPDREARCVHLGRTNVMRGEGDVNRYNKPFITDKVPEFRGHRLTLPRSYAVPYVEVVVPVAAARYEDVRTAVDSLLAGSVPDLVVTLVADWASLPEGRRPVLRDERLDLRLVRAAYAAEQRVRLRPSADERCDATFRLTLPGPDRIPVGRALERLVFAMENDHVGVTEILLADGPSARLERASTAARARRTSRDPASYDEALRAAARFRTTSAADAGFVPSTEVAPLKQVRGLVPWGTPSKPGLFHKPGETP